jgi:hypothetical protein
VNEVGLGYHLILMLSYKTVLVVDVVQGQVRWL